MSFDWRLLRRLRIALRYQSLIGLVACWAVVFSCLVLDLPIFLLDCMMARWRPDVSSQGICD